MYYNKTTKQISHLFVLIEAGSMHRKIPNDFRLLSKLKNNDVVFGKVEIKMNFSFRIFIEAHPSPYHPIIIIKCSHVSLSNN